MISYNCRFSVFLKRDITLSVAQESGQKRGHSRPFREDAKKQLDNNDSGSYYTQDMQWPSEYLRNENPKEKDVGAKMPLVMTMHEETTKMASLSF